MCSIPKPAKPQQYQVAQEAVHSDGDEEAAMRRGRRGTILSDAAGLSATTIPATGKTRLGQ